MDTDSVDPRANPRILTRHMFTIIGADGKEYGPVTTAAITEWIAAGRANLQTKARRDGETEWKSLGDFAEFNAPPVINPNSSPTPSAAAPTVAAPSATPTYGTAGEIASALAGQAATFDVFSCLSRSFELWKAHLLPLVGVTFLSMFLQWLMNVVPFIGGIAGLVLGGIFTGGLYYYYLGKMRGESRTVGDIFAGFNRSPGSLILTHLLMLALLFLVMLPFFGPLFFVAIKAFAHGVPAHGEMPAMSGIAVLGLMLGIIPLIYLSISWAFALVLVIDQGLGPWTALEVSRRVIGRRWFSMFGLAICAGILALLGVIGLFIGIFFTIPLGYGSLLYAYEDLCKPAAKSP